ncbi:MAG: hypothetical protein CVV52_12110 [Spirochaetae bacterium HGW-Spirochaetae-8]|nr:MAG: hypothetical protein CVV52_12110 [Spirochaetae bacterium HGW-Spirochaetae-8]
MDYFNISHPSYCQEKCLLGRETPTCKLVHAIAQMGFQLLQIVLTYGTGRVYMRFPLTNLGFKINHDAFLLVSCDMGTS